MVFPTAKANCRISLLSFVPSKRDFRFNDGVFPQMTNI